MKDFIKEFKAFAMRGNVIDLAVAVIIGTAFGKITTSLVNNIVMPIFGIILGGVNYADRSFTVGDPIRESVVEKRCFAPQQNCILSVLTSQIQP